MTQNHGHGDPADGTAGIPIGVGPRTGSDPNNSAQEVAVLRAEVRGLESVLKERAVALDKALETTARDVERRMDDRATAIGKALDLAKDAHDQRLEDRAIALEKAIAVQVTEYERRVADHWTTHLREHQMLQEAVNKAEASVDKRLEAMNELRAQITSERGTYLTRSVYETTNRDKMIQITANSDKLIVLSAELSSLREDLGAMKSGQEWVVRLVTGAVITAVIGLLFALFRTVPS